MQYTLLDPDHQIPVDQNNWAVAILRKPKGRNPEHAFLVVEGRSNFNQVILMRYDMVIDNNNPGNFTVVVKDKATSEARAQQVLGSEILGGDEVVGKTWSIAKTEAQRLHKNILDSQQNPGRYNLLGEGATLPTTAGATHAHLPASGEKLPESGKAVGESVSGKIGGEFLGQALSPEGHNCFTWARQMLFSLQIPEIQRDLPRSALDIVAVIPSRHVNKPSLAKEPASGPEFSCIIL